MHVSWLCDPCRPPSWVRSTKVFRDIRPPENAVPKVTSARWWAEVVQWDVCSISAFRFWLRYQLMYSHSHLHQLVQFLLRCYMLPRHTNTSWCELNDDKVHHCFSETSGCFQTREVTDHRMKALGSGCCDLLKMFESQFKREIWDRRTGGSLLNVVNHWMASLHRALGYSNLSSVSAFGEYI